MKVLLLGLSVGAAAGAPVVPCARISACALAAGRSCAAAHLDDDATKAAASTLIQALEDAHTGDDGCYKTAGLCKRKPGCGGDDGRGGGRGGGRPGHGRELRGRGGVAPAPAPATAAPSPASAEEDCTCEDPVSAAWEETGESKAAIEAYLACVADEEAARLGADDFGTACEDICDGPCPEVLVNSSTAKKTKNCRELCTCYFECPAANEAYAYDPAADEVSLGLVKDDELGRRCRAAFAEDIENFDDAADEDTKQTHFRGKPRAMLCEVLIKSRKDYDHRKFVRYQNELKAMKAELL